MSLFSLNGYDLVVSGNQRPDLHVRLGPHHLLLCSLYVSIFDNPEQVRYFRLKSASILFMSLFSLNGYDLVVLGNQRPDLHVRLGLHHLLLYSLYVSIFDNAQLFSAQFCYNKFYVIIQSEWLRSCRVRQPTARSTRTSRTPPFVVIFLICFYI